MSKLKIKDGNNWVEIPASGVGVPSGGTAGQALVKSSGTDYATEWDDISGIPSGGTAGQVLTKTSASDYAAAWATIPIIIDSGFEQFSTNANSIQDKSVAFTKSFPSTPTIMATIVSGSTSANIGRVTVTVSNASNTGFHLRIYNSDSSKREPGVYWMAIYQP